MKTCTKCGKEKELDQFHNRTIRREYNSKTYYSKTSVCRDCNKSRCKERRERKRASSSVG